MSKINWKEKLSSRKLWVAIIGIATGVVMYFGGEAEEITKISGAVVSVISTVFYIIAEGKVDVERLRNSIKSLEDAEESLKKHEEDKSDGSGQDQNN